MKNKNNLTTGMTAKINGWMRFIIFVFVLFAGTLFTATAQNGNKAQQPAIQQVQKEKAVNAEVKQAETTTGAYAPEAATEMKANEKPANGVNTPANTITKETRVVTAVPQLMQVDPARVEKLEVSDGNNENPK